VLSTCIERPKAPEDVFRDCGKLKSIHVPMAAKSWAGMKEWQGIPLVFEAKTEYLQGRVLIFRIPRVCTSQYQTS